MSEVAAFEGDGPERYVPTLLDAEVVPDDVAAWAAVVRPGSAVVSTLMVLDRERLSYEGRVDALVALQRQRAWLAAAEHRLLATMAGDPVVTTPLGEVDKQWVREDVACALRLSTNTASSRLAVARELTRLPATVALLERGEISTHHARALAEATLGLDQATATAIETAVLEKQRTPARRSTAQRSVCSRPGGRGVRQRARGASQRIPSRSANAPTR